MVATSGAQLLPGDAVRNLREKLLPMTMLVTPNIPEATLLLYDAEIPYEAPNNLDDLKTLARLVHQLGSQAVLLKGGHMPLTKQHYVKADKEDDSQERVTVDILYDGRDFTVIESEFLTVKNTHGTGCSLASAVASNIATQVTHSQASPVTTHISPSLTLAVRKAVHYVTTGIKLSTPGLGHGSGAINHFHNTSVLPFSRGHFIDDHLLPHPLVAPTWEKYTHHAFATGIARGTLPEPLFRNYLVQDYLYLTHFARTHALAAFKSQTMSGVAASASIIAHVEREMALHVSFCEDSFGISRAELEDPTRTKESLACTAYSRYVLDVGMSQDWLALQMALAPCLLGYGVAAERLYRDELSVSTEQGNRYWRWVENYVADDYREAVRVGRGAF